MKITFISPYADLTSFGIRILSSHLKKFGYKTQLIFLPDPYANNPSCSSKRYDEHILNELVSLCKDSDLIGITLMTDFFTTAIELTQRLKSDLKTPVIWGGVHPTIMPEESIQYADMVCIGDGEDALLDLVQRMSKGEDYLTTENFWIKSNGNVIKNTIRPINRNLDMYPFPDYSMEDHHTMFDGHIQPLTTELLKSILERSNTPMYFKRLGYQTMTGRGCPHKCTYCINDTIKGLYGAHGYLRWRSVDNVIDELLWVKNKLPYISIVLISDDTFFARNANVIEEFCKKYKEKINLPLCCLASPLTVTEEKMSMLVDAGLLHLQMGVESGSSKIQELFNRKFMSNERVLKAVKIINKFTDRMVPPSYDFIIDIPSETDKDKSDSVKLIAEFPKPFHLNIFSLVIYPGTKLFEMASKNGSMKTGMYSSRFFGTREANYFNILIALSKNGRFPSSLLKFLASTPVVYVLNNRFTKPLIKLLHFLYYKGFKTLRNSLNKAMQKA